MRFTSEQEQLALVSIVAELGEASLDRVVTVFNRRYYPIHREWAKTLLDAADNQYFPNRSLLCEFSVDERGSLHVEPDPGKLLGTSPVEKTSQLELLSPIDSKVRTKK